MFAKHSAHHLPDAHETKDKPGNLPDGRFPGFGCSTTRSWCANL